MRAFTVRFSTISHHSDLLADAGIRAKLKEFGVDLDVEKSVFSKIVIITQKVTQVKFSENGIYETLIEDMVYDSETYHPFSNIIIKDNAVAGTITFRLG